ncbi:MAG: hypothetical protein KUG79_16700 [Pseudomonadales bacterium]|nr:hypothetical protein [Pseudomonadales bacterium]
MNQTVNFYEKLGPEKTLSKELVIIWVVWFAVIIGYVVWSLVILTGRWSQEESIQALQGINESLEEKIRLEGLNLDRNGLLKLESKLAALRVKRQGQKVLLANLQDPQFSNIEGFSAVFLGLARQHQPGLTVEKVSLLTQGQIFQMAGRVDQPMALPKYLVRLGIEQAFENMQFETIEIGQAEVQLAQDIDGAKDGISFNVRSWAEN